MRGILLGRDQPDILRKQPMVLDEAAGDGEIGGPLP